MELTVQKTDKGICRIRISGQMNIYEAAGLRERLAGVFRDIQSCASLEFDLSGVSELDTSGVQLLVLARRETSAMGKDLRITAHSAATEAAIELYNLRDFLG